VRSFWARVKSLLARLVPFGLLVREKPRHYREMLRVLWENRGRWRYAWRVLAHGVCDGCSLGPRGLRDDVIPGVHLCLTRLKLLRLNTMPRAREKLFSDVKFLRGFSNEELHRLGRLPYPMVRLKDAPGFSRIPWDEAIRVAAGRVAATPGDRQAWFVSSRGLTNEAYYAIQKLARIAGSPNVDSCARLCHAASTSGLKATIGWGAPTCSLSDLIGTDLVILIGSNVANNQPVMTKYLHEARKRGTRVVAINPFREPALERYWVPSVPSSALFGTPLVDEFFSVKPGGDIAFLYGVLKAMSTFDEAFISERTTGFEELRRRLYELQWPELEAGAGVPRLQMQRFAALYTGATTSVIVYSMGLTQYTFGVDNVKMVANLALARGNIGKPLTGILPIRGHSGVQGTAECGVDADKLPGGLDINPTTVARFERAWGHAIPHERGLKAAHALDRSAEGGIDLLWCVGGNFLETMPDPEHAMKGLTRPKVRVHQDILLNSSALADAEEMVLLLPSQTRYESGGTSTSTERRVRFSPQIVDPEGPAVPEARADWEICAMVGRALGKEAQFGWTSTADVRQEMGALMPLYQGIEKLAAEGDSVQWGGPRLGADGFPNLPGGRARFSVVDLPRIEVPAGKFFMTSRRGKQFNSITYGQRDSVSAASSRRDVLFASEDLRKLGLNEGDAIVLRNEVGELRGQARAGPCRPGHVQAFWPESNAITQRRYDPVSGEPDYNAVVSVERA
jgi:molybdopterin-dependent oxidoreductase alpha subunit